MLGLRGVRLGIHMPELVRMQVRAIFEAACGCVKAGVKVKPKIMIPLAATSSELRVERDLLEQEARVVANDNTVRYQGLSLQIPQAPHRFHYVQVTVRVHAYPDGTLAVFHGPRCLARYHAEGVLQEATVTARPQPTHRRARR